VTRRRAALASLVVVTCLAHPAVAGTGAPRADEGVWPLEPVHDLVAGFDPPGTPWDPGHRGVDLAGSAGQSVRAALAGTVSYAGRIAGRGVVVVDHGLTRTTYEPVDATAPLGTAVAGGDVIGTLALAGSHCLPRACLHWGLREGDTYLDPLSLVGGGPVRLLPLWQEVPAAIPARRVTADIDPTARELTSGLATLDPTRTMALTVLAAAQARGCACR
jgi:murein DD-endopeptidase MepM/ murein hydrolase activator NlpD